jgi:hypothetical protein
MLESVRAEEVTSGEGQPSRWSDQPNGVAGRVDHAIFDDRVLDVMAGDAVVAGEELAARDPHVAIP